MSLFLILFVLLVLAMPELILIIGAAVPIVIISILHNILTVFKHH